MHQTTIKVRFYELDPYNHVNHAAFIQYFEVGRVELLDSVGFGLASLRDAGLHIVVTGITTRFLRSAGPGDELVVETGVGQINRASSQWRQRVLRGDLILATQTVDGAMTDVSGRPTRLPTELSEALKVHLVDDS